MAVKKIRFIVNPHSGIKKKKDVQQLIHQYVDKTKYEYEIVLTQAPKHATELSREAANHFDIVVAAGGDGSVNEVAKGILGSNSSLGIIPLGSGNGMARHLSIPMEPEKALAVINNGRSETIDTMEVNNEFAIGTIGIGFDAHIAHLFAKAATRGYSTYVKLVLQEFYKYKPVTYSINVDGQDYLRECFLFTCANSSQFGNNAVIAPFADEQDGIIDISIMKKFAFRFAPHLIYRLLHNTIHLSKFFEMMNGHHIIVRNQGKLQGHIDGEPVTFNGDMHVKINPMSLNVIVS
jgi:diacylglycerol kinase (ATP)